MKKFFLLATLVLAMFLPLICGNINVKTENVSAISGLSFLNHVTLLEEIETPEQLANTRADVAIVHLNGEGMLDLGGAATPFDAEQFGESIPCFYIDTEEAARAAVELISARAPYSYICSGNAELVSFVRRSCPLACGMIDFRESGASGLQIRDTVNKNYAKSALVSCDRLTQDDALTLRKLLITLYVETSSTAESYTALAYGADGLVGNAEDIKYSLTLPEADIYAPRPFLVAHRANSAAMRDDGLSLYAENTVPAAQAAYSQFRPDFIEIDLQLSSDGHVVIMHDSTLDRMTNGTGNIADMTLEQIRRYKIDGGAADDRYLDEIPVLDDFFEEFRNTDLFFMLEIKTGDPACVDAAVEAIKKYDMAGQVNFISFSSSQLEYAREKCPEISISLLTGSGYDGNSADFAKQVMKIVNPMNASLSPDCNTVDAENAGELARYGIKANAWTVNTPSEFYGRGFATVTTDMCHAAEDAPFAITPDKSVFDINVGEKFEFGAQITARNSDFDAHASCKAIPLTDGLTLREEGGGYIADTEGEGKFALIYESPYYGVISVPVTVRAAGSGGCSGNMNASFPLFSCCIAAAVFLVRTQRKN